MIKRILLALLNGVIVFIALNIIVVILGSVNLGAIGNVISPFIFGLSLLVGALTFLGVIPDLWKNL